MVWHISLLALHLQLFLGHATSRLIYSLLLLLLIYGGPVLGNLDIFVEYVCLAGRWATFNFFTISMKLGWLMHHSLEFCGRLS